MMQPTQQTITPISEITLDETEPITVKGNLTRLFIHTYTACETCKRSKNCSCQDHPDTINQIVVNGSIEDETGFIKFTMFNDVAENLLNRSANDIAIMKLFEPEQFENFLFYQRLLLEDRPFHFTSKIEADDYNPKNIYPRLKTMSFEDREKNTAYDHNLRQLILSFDPNFFVKVF